MALIGRLGGAKGIPARNVNRARQAAVSAILRVADNPPAGPAKHYGVTREQ
jgi:hypothetical protein